MIGLLEQVIAEASKLPKDAQEEFARLMLKELAKKRWKQQMVKPSLSLREMIDETRRDIAEGRTRPLVPDEL